MLATVQSAVVMRVPPGVEKWVMWQQCVCETPQLLDAELSGITCIHIHVSSMSL